MWFERPKDGPKWPTFKGATLDQENTLRIVDVLKNTLEADGFLGDFKLIQFGFGHQYVREMPNGGFVHGGGTRTLYPTVSMELQAYVESKAGRGTPVYLILWIGGYMKGSIMHCGWQFPHCEAFRSEELAYAARGAYLRIAELVYGSRPMPVEVTRFFTAPAHGE